MTSQHGGTLHQQARRIVYNAIKFFDDEKVNGTKIPVNKPTERAAACLHLNKNTVCKIRSEGRKAERLGVQITTPKRRKIPPVNKIVLHDIEKCIIRRKFLEYYEIRKEIPTLRKLHNFCQQELQFQGSKETLRKIVKSIGFQFRKCRNKRSLLCEQEDIIARRAHFLRFLRTNETNEKRPVVYINETCIHTHYTVKRWQSDSVPDVFSNSSTEQRLIMVHAGGNMGFIPGAFHAYDSKSKTSDYHEVMDSDNFTKWIIEKLIPGLPEGSIVVLDNAPYHNRLINKAPSSNTRKSEIQSWLTENKISFHPDMCKSELLLLVKRNRPQPVYQIDEILQDKGFVPLRLPPFHSDLNPMELMWNMVKMKVWEKSMSQVSLSDLKNMTSDAVGKITKEDWERAVAHANKIANEYRERDALLETAIEEISVTVGLESDDESSDDSETISASDETMSASKIDSDRGGSSTDTADERPQEQK